MQISIILFGQLVDITGSNNLTVQDVSDTNTLVQHLHKQFPALATIKYVIAVDKKIINKNTALSHHTTIALLPPFSGG